MRRVVAETLFEVGLVRIVGGVGVVMRVAAVAETIVNLVDKRNSSLTAGLKYKKKNVFYFAIG